MFKFVKDNAKPIAIGAAAVVAIAGVYIATRSKAQAEEKRDADNNKTNTATNSKQQTTTPAAGGGAGAGAGAGASNSATASTKADACSKCGFGLYEPRPPTTCTTTATDGATIAYYDSHPKRCEGCGAPDLTVFLIHGYLVPSLASWTQWSDYFATLQSGVGGTSGKRCRARVIAADMRGHGGSHSPHDTAAYGCNTMAADCSAVMTAAGISRVTDARTDGWPLYVMGYSMGADVAVRLAARDSRVRRLVLGGHGSAMLEDKWENLEDYLAALRAPSDEAAAHLSARARTIRAMAELVGGDKEALACVAEAARGCTKQQLERIKVPTLVVAGQEDASVGSPEDLAACIADATVVRPPGDHLSVVASPEFRHAVREFLFVKL